MKKKKKYIHVNQHKIRSNKKNKTNEPVISVKIGKHGSSNEYCDEVWIEGPCKVMYCGNDKPILPCGARVVIETESEVRCINND